MAAITRIGRPSLDDDETVHLTFRVPAGMAAELKRRARSHGGHGAVLRQLVGQYLSPVDAGEQAAS